MSSFGDALNAAMTASAEAKTPEAQMKTAFGWQHIGTEIISNRDLVMTQAEKANAGLDHHTQNGSPEATIKFYREFLESSTDLLKALAKGLPKA